MNNKMRINIKIFKEIDTMNNSAVCIFDFICMNVPDE